jgi:hypothetical protein
MTSSVGANVGDTVARLIKVGCMVGTFVGLLEEDDDTSSVGEVVGDVIQSSSPTPSCL